jgi:hypothetical protein
MAVFFVKVYVADITADVFVLPVSLTVGWIYYALFGP